MMKRTVFVMALSILISGLAAVWGYADAVSLFDLGMGARPLAMGGAFVGLADDGNTMFYNPAGLAWNQNLSLLSSYETRPGIGSYGSIAISMPYAGFGVSYFDFGDIPKTDDYGNVIGNFSYREYALVAGAGIKVADLPFLTRVPLAQNIGIGLGVKFLKASTLEPGSGSGFAIDLPFLFRSESPSLRVPIITNYGFGLVIENIIGVPIKYGSGHQENWPIRAIVGASLGLMNKMILTMDVTNNKSFHAGLEWTPLPAVSFRAGIRNEAVWIWSLGMGLRFRNFVFNFAVAPHSYINSQLRGSLEVSW